MNASILVVEDNQVLRSLFVKQLVKLGFECDSATHGGEAIQLFKANPQYRLILMDVMMPEVDGLEATAQIRNFEQAENLVRVPIVGITAMDNQDRCLAAGMDDYYRKPLLTDQLIGLIEKWIPGHGS
jgi:CheY-like chemotaxis protein